MRCKRCNKWSMTLNKQKLCKTCEAALSSSSRTHHHSDDSFLPLSPTFDTNSDSNSSHHQSDFEPGGGSFGGGGSSGSWDSGSSDSGSSDCGSCGGD